MGQSTRHAASDCTKAEPFLRWAGAKRKYTKLLLNYLPKRYETYYEPFLGAGSLFFATDPPRAVLGDVIEPLMETYSAVRDHPMPLWHELQKWPVDKATYYETRALVPRNKIEHAAQFIYLNKTCWNGLYRVNRSGGFNVPYGMPKSQNVASPANLVACSNALKRSTELYTQDFELTLQRAQYCDFAFLDPPYVTTHTKNGFVEYNESLFSWADQCRLAQVVKDLDQRGVKFLMTNADHESVIQLYQGFDIQKFERLSTIASNRQHRRQVSELLISNNPRLRP
jgi:DNA adenine methylase